MELQIFNNEVFGQVRVSMIDGAPWFVAPDVCKALDITNSTQALSRLNDKDKNTLCLNEGIRGNPYKRIVNESGLYALILTSRKKEAEQFKYWVTSEVLPTIRKTGGYVANEAMFIDAYLPFADEATKALFSNTLQVIRQQNVMIADKNAQLETQRPLVEFAETVQKSGDNILMGALAKLMCENGTKIGAKRLFQLMRDEKVLMANNVPYQAYVDDGYFHVKEGYHKLRSGEVKLNFTTLVTPRGQIWAMKRVKKVLNARTA
jgi:anti-repressor protein